MAGGLRGQDVAAASPASLMSISGVDRSVTNPAYLRSVGLHPPAAFDNVRQRDDRSRQPDAG
ncbi:MAG: hypothetical protein IVW53_04040 [Chloroflexi bacterium]|nr:hypothetical protein [Chloroflexota bacterium]